MKNLRGRVVSNKAMKTATVLVETHKTHPLYGKSYIQTKKFLVDDQIGVAIGDIVEFVKTRPISKLKHWQIVKIVGRDIIAVESQVMKEAAKEAIEEVLPVEEKENEVVESEVEVAEEVKTTEEKPAKKAKAKKGDK